jgi:hypothetical protein
MDTLEITVVSHKDIVGNIVEIARYSVSPNGSPISSVIPTQSKLPKVKSGINVCASVVLVNVVEAGSFVSSLLEVYVGRELRLECTETDSFCAIDGELPVHVSVLFTAFELASYGGNSIR